MSSLQTTPRANRLHIALFGITNAGKSSLINALTGQEIALVSAIKGTTTDPVYKAMELAPWGPVVFIDTAGLDDLSALGKLRKKKTLEVLKKTDIAILVCDAAVGFNEPEQDLLIYLQKRRLPFLVVFNKIELLLQREKSLAKIEKDLGIEIIATSTVTKEGLLTLKEALIKLAASTKTEQKLIGDLIEPNEIVVLVVPLDESAPQGRLILPQQQTLRDLLDHQVIGIVTKPEQLKEVLLNLKKPPALIITDSQIFSEVGEVVPQDIPLTSFSILFARYKGDLSELLKGVEAIQNLKDGDKILIAEACTHHRQADDIGTVKIPHWLQQKTGKKLQFELSSGYSFPENLPEFALIIHCAGCMLNRQAMLQRINQAKEAGMPIVNYGVLIAYLHGILERALEPFQGNTLSS